jgi:hypothetical protein
MSFKWYLPSLLNVNPTTVFDADALTYINNVQAAGRTLTSAEKGYINTLIVAGKAHGWWAKMYDGGIFLWGTSAPSRVTLKGVSTLTDSDAPTYSSAGAAFNGTTNFITTNINPSTALTVDDTHLSMYVTTAPELGIHYDIGCKVADSNHFSVSARVTGGTEVVMYRNNGTSGSIRVGGSGACFVVGSRTSNTLLTLYKNGSSIGTLTASNINPTLTNLVMYIGAINLNNAASSFSARTYTFWSVGAGLSSTQAADMSADVNAFMTSMGVNVF